MKLRNSYFPCNTHTHAHSNYHVHAYTHDHTKIYTHLAPAIFNPTSGHLRVTFDPNFESMTATAPKVAELACLEFEVRQLSQNSSTTRQRQTGLPVTEFPQHLFRPLWGSDVTCVCGVWCVCGVLCGVFAGVYLVCVGTLLYRSFETVPPPVVSVLPTDPLTVFF